MKDYLYIIIPAAIVLVGVVIFLFKKRKKRIENEYQAMRKRQDASLKDALANPFKDNKESEGGSYRPYKVKYKGGGTDDKKDNQPLIQVIEKTKISEKKYLFKSDDKIMIGDQYGTIKVMTELDNFKPVYEIIFIQDSYCIKLLDRSTRVMLVRGRKKLNLNNDIIKLKSGDAIKVSESEFLIKMIK